MLLKEKNNQVLESGSDQNQKNQLSNSYIFIDREIDPQQSDLVSNATTEENWESLSPINLIKLLGILAIGSTIIVGGAMNHLSCGVSGNQGSSPTFNSK